MSMRVTSDSKKFPDKIYIGYASKSSLDLLKVLEKIRETPEFSEEDWEFSGTDLFFVRPGILPLLDCRSLKSPLYAWESDVFKEMTIIRLEYGNLDQRNWKITLDLSIPSPDYRSDIANVICEDGKMTYFTGSGEDGLKLMLAMGLNKLEEYYERESIRNNP